MKKFITVQGQKVELTIHTDDDGYVSEVFACLNGAEIGLYESEEHALESLETELQSMNKFAESFFSESEVDSMIAFAKSYRGAV